MNRSSKRYALAATIVAIGSIACAARGSIENDAMSVTKAKISLAQAATTAELHVNGKAARAEYEDSKHGWVYDVEVVTATKVFDVTVDANKGSVIPSTEDTEDHDDDHDKKD